MSKTQPQPQLFVRVAGNGGVVGGLPRETFRLRCGAARGAGLSERADG